MAITVWCLRTFRDHEGQDLASDSDEQMLIYIPGMHVCVGDQNWHDWWRTDEQERNKMKTRSRRHKNTQKIASGITHLQRGPT